MKTRMALLISSTILIAATHAFADDTHDAHHAAAAAASSSTSAMMSAHPGAQYEAMRSEMFKIMDQMHQIRQTKNPVERRRLLGEHMQTMQETMRMMRTMGGPMMMGMSGGQQTGGPAMHAQGASGGVDVSERMTMLDQRMDMMQMMMEQMMQQQNPPAPAH
ncbi:hypothetical protein KEX41_28635 (plasmid) [Burkholderia thailandensis]|uniref:hypothetical protein n=1 Tax=Burkholderia thailandensis TaxID=57975 RepID=UPI00192D21F9|nr:hypothetical protein [Burkholderia thailandensis]MBS2132154.1 hypothetical protein [Burkholderia thailandensis]QRA15257.1 hypothetical protein JMY07_29060 [Burkholderia thailandensis]